MVSEIFTVLFIVVGNSAGYLSYVIQVGSRLFCTVADRGRSLGKNGGGSASPDECHPDADSVAIETRQTDPHLLLLRCWNPLLILAGGVGMIVATWTSNVLQARRRNMCLIKVERTGAQLVSPEYIRRGRLENVPRCEKLEVATTSFIA